jgi:hypothetical protein
MELISDGTAVTMVTQPLVMDVISMEELNQDTHATGDARTDQIDAGLLVVTASEYDPKDEMTVILQTEMGAVIRALLKQGTLVLVVITGQVTSAMKYVAMVLILDIMIEMTVIL